MQREHSLPGGGHYGMRKLTNGNYNTWLHALSKLSINDLRHPAYRESATYRGSGNSTSYSHNLIDVMKLLLFMNAILATLLLICACLH